MGTIIKASMIIAIIGTLATKGITAKAEDILNKTQGVVDQANVSQLSTAVELYYLDHNSYPPAADGIQLINILENGRYIRNRPSNPSAFQYQMAAGSNDYILTLK